MATQVSGLPLVSLSEQYLLNCDSEGTTNIGCQGGNYIESLKWIMANDGLVPSASVPYTGKVGSCESRSSTFHCSSCSSCSLPRAPSSSRSSCLERAWRAARSGVERGDGSKLARVSEERPPLSAPSAELEFPLLACRILAMRFLSCRAS